MEHSESSFLGKILVTTDFSEASFEAFPFAANEAQTYGGKLELINVFHSPPIQFVPYEGSFNPEQLAAFLKEERTVAEQKLENLAHSRFPDLKAGAVTLEALGNIGDAIVDYAASVRAGLIVTATHGHGFVRRAFLGSVAERMLRRTECPILMIPTSRREGSCLPYRRIVVTTDFSPASEDAFPIARAECERSGAELVLLHVSEELAALELVRAQSSMVAEEVERQRGNYLAEAARRVEEYSKKFHPVKFSQVVIDPVHSVSNSIAEYLERTKADLLIIGARGRTGTHNLLGGVVERVTRHATCPVLVVPTARTKEK